MRWTLPDTGFVLQYSPALAPTAWADFSLPDLTTDGNSKVGHVLQAALPNSARGFFRMLQRP